MDCSRMPEVINSNYPVTTRRSRGLGMITQQIREAEEKIWEKASQPCILFTGKNVIWTVFRECISQPSPRGGCRSTVEVCMKLVAKSAIGSLPELFDMIPVGFWGPTALAMPDVLDSIQSFSASTAGTSRSS
ncbi:hypothetical protein WG66_013040 [Moniliophthora roreri]|nr:hypothetical protein WG66_013040 [Moniliophthora roreri]